MKLFAPCDPGSAVVVVEGAGLGTAPTPQRSGDRLRRGRCDRRRARRL